MTFNLGEQVKLSGYKAGYKHKDYCFSLFGDVEKERKNEIFKIINIGMLDGITPIIYVKDSYGDSWWFEASELRYLSAMEQKETQMNKHNYNFNVGDLVVLSGHKEHPTGDRWRFADEYVLKHNDIKPKVPLIVKKVDTDDNTVLVAATENVAGVWFDRSELRFASSRVINKDDNALKLVNLDFEKYTYILEGRDGKLYFAYHDDGDRKRNIWCIVMTDESDDTGEELAGTDMQEYLNITNFKCIVDCFLRKPQ